MTQTQRTYLVLIIALPVAAGIGCGDPYEEGVGALNAGQYKEALAKFQQVPKLDADYQFAKRRIKELYFLIGQEAYDRGAWDEAAEYLNQVTSDDRAHHPQAQSLLGSIVYRRGKAAYDRQDWEEAGRLLQSVPEKSRAYNDAQDLLKRLQERQ